MRKILYTIGFLLLSLAIIAPNVVFAAYNDVQFDADTNVYLEGIPTTLVIASGGNVAGMTVCPSSVAFDMENLSSVTISNSDKRTLNNTMDATVTCGSSASSITLTSSTTQIVTVTIGASCEPSGGSGAVSSYTPPAPTPEPEPEPGDYTTESECEAASYYWYDSVCNAEEEVIVVPTVTATGEATATAAAGGEASATTDEGAEAGLNVPAEAVTADTTVSVTPTATSADAVSAAVGSVPSGQSLVGGYVYDYSAIADGQAVSSFDESVTLTMTYTDDQVSGYDESSLTINYWDETAGIWVALGTTVDQENNTLTATTDHFTYFAIVGQETEEVVEEEEEEEVPVAQMTIAELKAKIAELKALIAVAIAKLAALLGTSPITGIPADFSFTANMSQGESSSAVKYLQIVLNSSADTKVASTGVGSPGNETNYFGSLTKAAVIKFQEKYSSVVLDPWGFTSGTGFVGSTTREKLNSLLGK